MKMIKTDQGTIPIDDTEIIHIEIAIEIDLP